MNALLSVGYRSEQNKRFWNAEIWLVAGMLICCALTGYLPSNLISVMVLAISVGLVFTDNIYLAFPIMIFYYLPFGNFMGMSVYRYFSLLLFCCIFINHYKKMKIKISYFIVLVLYFIYSMYLGLNYNIRTGIFAFFDVICVFLLAIIYLSDTLKIKKFFEVYVFAALISYFTGLNSNFEETLSYKIGNEFVEITRNSATFEDSNYMGFFFSIAVFAMITLKLFNKKLRIIFTIALYLIMFSTVSMTMIMGNIIFWSVYLVVTKQINIKTIVIVWLIIGILFSLYFYGLSDPDLPIFGALSLRIEDKISALMDNDMDSFTTNRSHLSEVHLEIFSGQSLLKKLFGFNAANTLVLDLPGTNSAAHNEYVDLLLNVGIVGTIILIGFAILRTFDVLKATNKNEDAVCIFMIKIIWFYYAATLTIFMDFRFFFAFLL